jgi:hypothetical protein
MKTYYIVKHEEYLGGTTEKSWWAHKRGLSSTMGVYGYINYIIGTRSMNTADDCEDKLRFILANPVEKTRVIRVVKI